MTDRRCARCHLLRPIEEFRRKAGTTYRESYCRRCNNAKRMEYYHRDQARKRAGIEARPTPRIY